jgi:hypothetical protein
VSLLFALFLLLMATALFLALKVGGKDERLAAAALLAAALASPIVQSHSYAAPEMGIVLVDAILFIALLLLALRSSAFWPMWAAGFQLCALAVHFAAAKSPHMMPATYAETLALWAFPQLLALLFGTWYEARMRDGQR